MDAPADPRAPTLCLLGCDNFAAEMRAAVAIEGWPDVVVRSLPARCGRPPLTWDAIRAILPEQCTLLILIGRVCVQGLGPPPTDFPAIRTETAGQCFHFVAPELLVDEALEAGAYLLTSAWLADWPARLAELGFDPALAKTCFGEFARELCLLDSGADRAAGIRLAELGDALALPVRRVTVGLDSTRLRLGRLVHAWRDEMNCLQQSVRDQRHNGELADHVAAMDLLRHLSRAGTEDEAVESIRELFQMLFAPASLHFVRVERGLPLPEPGTPAEEIERLTALAGEYDWLDGHSGFLLRIRHGDATVGLISVRHLAFPEYHQRYLNLAMAISSVCGMAIDNARNRRYLLEAEKIASLSLVVAGVAHEINTPLGVSLAAASNMAGRTQELAARFDARAMTQADLRGYFDDIGTCASLIGANLDRIGELVDKFRSVAVKNRGTPAAHALRLRPCLDEVITAYHTQLAEHRIEVAVDCALDVDVPGAADDWVMVFSNLLSNSLKHAFAGRTDGQIRISAQRVGDSQRIEYSDDGVGIEPAALAHVFDPFYTTDMRNGMGLGMHLVYNLVSHHLGGSIRCFSELGQGVRFAIELPPVAPKGTRP